MFECTVERGRSIKVGHGRWGASVLQSIRLRRHKLNVQCKGKREREEWARWYWGMAEFRRLESWAAALKRSPADNILMQETKPRHDFNQCCHFAFKWNWTAEGILKECRLSVTFSLTWKRDDTLSKAIPLLTAGPSKLGCRLSWMYSTSR